MSETREEVRTGGPSLPAPEEAILHSCPQLVFVPLEEADQFVVFDPSKVIGSTVNATTRDMLCFFQGGRRVSDLIPFLEGKYQVTLTSEQCDFIHGFTRDLVRQSYLQGEPYALDLMQDLWSGRTGALYLHTTYDCNLRCVYCYNYQARKGARDTSKDLPLGLEQWRQVLEGAKAAGIERIFFTGGEPLMSPDLFPLASHAKSLGLKSELLTNGTLITGENAPKLVDLFEIVNISMDSLDAQTNDKTRGPGSFSRIKAGLDHLIAAGHERIAVSPVMTKHNLGSLPLLIEFSKEHPQVRVKTVDYCAYKSPDNPYNSELEISAEERQHLNDILKARNQSNFIMPSPLEFRDGCGMLRGEVSVDPFGWVFPCQSLHYEPFRLGNILDQDLGEILKSSIANTLRESGHVDSIETCNECGYRYICGGGCRAIAYARFGDIKAHNGVDCARFQTECQRRLKILSKMDWPEIREIDAAPEC